MLPGPVGVVFRPLLVTSRDSDLVRRMVFLVTDQIWIIVLAIFLNNCHSTRANGSLLSTASACFAYFLSLSGRSVALKKKKKSKRSRGAKPSRIVFAHSHHGRLDS